MKRKILTLALGLSMLVGLMVNANAVASPVGDAVKPDDPNPAGVAVETDASKLTGEAKENLETAIEAVKADPAAFVESTGLTQQVAAILANTNVAVEDLVATKPFNLSLTDEAAKELKEKGSVELTFKVDGIKDGDTIVVLVFNGTEWVVAPAVIKDGKVVITVTCSGAVVIMKADQAAAEGSVTSPQTSGANLEGVMICGVVLSLAVLALCIKRSRMA